MHSGKFTKIIATIGPASESLENIEKLILAGVNVFRFNMKHNTKEWHLDKINTVQAIADRLNLTIGIMIDLQGPEIRIETIGTRDINLVKDEEVIFTNEFQAKFLSTDKCVRIAHGAVLENLSEGDRFSIEDGYHNFLVTKKIDKKTFVAKIENDGVIKNRKSLNIVGKDINLPSLIDEDLDKLDIASKTKTDFVALSYTRTKEDIEILKKELKDRKIDARIVAKIENQLGLDNIEEIIEKADAVMIARGDLGIETPIEKIAYYQKEIIKKCRNKSKPVIVATQMLQSMVEKPLPTRAEAADVANATFDKTDCVMLSEETATGKYPVKAVETMRKILKFNEMKTFEDNIDMNIDDQTRSLAKAGIEMISHNYEHINKVILFTESGYTARVFSSYRPKLPVIALSNNKKTVETLTMSFGIISFYTDFITNEYHEPPAVIKELVKIGLVDKGEKVLILHGRQWMDKNRTNALAILEA